MLDEINELDTKTLEVMRQPIEDKVVTISRAKGSLSFPANFMLVAAHNPCPCGYFQDSTRACSCSPSMISRYQSKLSGPLLDRIDIHVDVPRVDYDKLMSNAKGESSATIQERVEKARQRQKKRFEGRKGMFANGDMGAGEIQELCILEADARQIMEVSVKRLQLSARSYHRVLKLSRTIADLGESETIKVQHVAEALQYRPKT
jgi:magnesium chelatase family protein